MNEYLGKTVDSVAEDIAEYAKQIRTGEYGPAIYEVYSVSSDGLLWSGAADSEDDAFDGYRDDTVIYAVRSDVYIEQSNETQYDEPTLVDRYGNTTPIGEYPLEVVDERGRPFAVVIGTGGPHIEVTADGDSSARLVGYHGSDKAYRYGDVFDTFLDWFIER